MADADTDSWQRVDHGELHERLDRALGEMLGLSRSQVRQFLNGDRARLNGRVLTERDKGVMLVATDLLEIRPMLHPDEQLPIPNPALPLTILAESADWVVIDKPASMAVHPLKPEETDTALNALMARYPQMAGVGEGSLRSGVVHRIDLTTTGTVIFALNQPTWTKLREAFKTHTITKQYLALVQGPLEGSDNERHRLVIARHRPAQVRVLGPEAEVQKHERLCTLAWQAVETFSDAALVSIDLGTGFLHQIRAIFAHLGHPLLGDELYSKDPVSAQLAPRPMLHAHRLACDGIEAIAPMPADMQAVLRRLRA